MLEISEGQGFESLTKVRRFFARLKRLLQRRLPRKVAVPLFISLLLLIGGLGSWYYFAVYRQPEQSPKINQDDPYAQNIQKIEKGPVPKEPLDRAIYYSQIAANYETLKASDKALEYYFKAQSTIDDANLTQQLAFYRAIGDLYAQKHDKNRAKVYYRKEILRLQEYKKANPDDTGTDEVIREVQKAIDRQ